MTNQKTQVIEDLGEKLTYITDKVEATMTVLDQAIYENFKNIAPFEEEHKNRNHLRGVSLLKTAYAALETIARNLNECEQEITQTSDNIFQESGENNEY